MKIIAEIGINHNGDIDVAKRLATESKDAGCDYVKLQKRCIERCYTKEDLAAVCESPWGDTVADKVYGRELSWDQIAEFDTHCRDIGIEWTASCFDSQSLNELHEKYPDRPFNKVASCMALSFDYLIKIALEKKLAIISTGLNKEKQITKIVNLFHETNCPFVVNHCVAQYPAKPEQLNMNFIHNLFTYYGCHMMDGVGYSSHDVGFAGCVVAASMNAQWIEKHVTLDQSMYGADQDSSMEMYDLRKLVKLLREIELSLGKCKKVLTGDEKVPVKA